MSIDNVYKLFGEASHWASILEEQLWNICAMNERVINQDKYKTEDPKSIIKEFEKKTIGQLIGLIKKVLGKDFEDMVDKIFKPALEKRNRLIHDFFIEHHENLLIKKNFESAVSELNEIISIIFIAADFATKTSVLLAQNFRGDNVPNIALKRDAPFRGGF